MHFPSSNIQHMKTSIKVFTIAADDPGHQEIWHWCYGINRSCLEMENFNYLSHSISIVCSAQFRHRSKKTSKLCITGLCEGNPPARGSPHKGPVMWKMFPFDNVIMCTWTITRIPTKPLNRNQYLSAWDRCHPVSACLSKWFPSCDLFSDPEPGTI